MEKKKRSNAGAIGAIVLLILFLAGAGVILHWERNILPGNLPQEQTDPGTAGETALPTAPTMPEPVNTGITTLNVLLIGKDQWDMEDYGRSDTVILCSLDADSDTVTMVSFLRDLYVTIPGHSQNKLNAAYALGGAELLVETLHENFGVHVDATIEIDFSGYIRMIDYFGGVEIDLTAEEADYLNSGKIWTPDQDGSWNLTEGVNLLTGTQTLAYSRIRKLDSDFVRTERQRGVLKELMKKFHDSQREQMLEAMDCLLDQSVTSMTQQELMLYAMGFYPVLMEGTLVSLQVPAEGTWSYDTVSGMSVIRVDAEANREILAELLPAE